MSMLADLVREYRKLAKAERRSYIRDRGDFSGSYTNEGIAAMARSRHEFARAERHRRLAEVCEQFRKLEFGAAVLDLLSRERAILDKARQNWYLHPIDDRSVKNLRREIRILIKGQA